VKKIWQDPFVTICAVLVLYFTYNFISSFGDPDPTSMLKEAQMNYLAGEKTQNVDERKKTFNASLNSFLELEQNYAPTFGNGKLYFDIGNTFFQLEQYPEALLYYYRAQQLRPTDATIDSNIALAQNKLNISSQKDTAAFDWLFFFHRHFSLPERLQLVFLGTFLAFVFMSLYLWYPRRLIYGAIIATVLLTLPFLLSVCYTYAFASMDGVMVKSSLLYRDAGEQYAKVKPEPISSGLKVQILDITVGGRWLKVMTKDGTVGYVPEESIRTI
jgi:tetratricopeptide (TPR) repeat protein